MFGALALAALISAFIVDVSMGIPLYVRSRPDFSTLSKLRSWLMALGGAWIVLSLWPLPQRARVVVSKFDFLSFTLHEKSLVFFTYLFYLLLPILLWYSPAYFSSLAQEDGPIENLTVLFLIGASIFMLVSAKNSESFAWLPVSIAILFFGIAMEELSWLQRILGFDLPESLRNAGLEETTLHNIAVNKFETASYSICLAFLVLLPQFFRSAGHSKKDNNVRWYLPDELVTIAAIPAFCLECGTWSSLPAQLAFYCCIWVLVLNAVSAKNISSTGVCFVVIVLLVITQLVFVQSYDRLVRKWDPTEYKELLIAWSFLLYAYRTHPKVLKLKSVV